MYGCPARSAITIKTMNSQPPPTPPPTTSTVNMMVLKCAVAIVIGLLVAAVALAYAGWKSESIVGLLTAIGTLSTGLLVGVARLVSVEQKVDQVARQTNGALRDHVTETVRTELRAALADQLGQPITPPPTTPRKRR
jgi:hypothetical protein